MRNWLLLLVAACSSPATAPHDPTPAAPTAPAAPIAAQPVPDAGAGSAAAPAREPATEIQPVAIAGPYPSLADSCNAAPPCGFLDMDAMGRETRPATKPRCDAVLDPTHDMVGNVPFSISPTGATPAMTHKTAGGEIRIGGVRCDVPKGLRREHAMYYVFVQRADGWWRTATSMFDYDYNDKYCSGGLYIIWNDKPSRTIAGIAAAGGCLTCTKQAQYETTVELMLRVETTGDKPAVFPFLPVGVRHRTDMLGSPDSTTDPECKATRSASSLKETWPADDEVVLAGTTIAIPRDLPTLQSVVGDGNTRPGRYRFER